MHFVIKDFIKNTSQSDYLKHVEDMAEKSIIDTDILKQLYTTEFGEMSYGRVLANLICNLPFNVFHADLPDEFVINYALTKKTLNKHFSNVIAHFYDSEDGQAINLAMAESFRLTAYTSTNITANDGISTSIKELIDVSKRNPRIHELLRWDIPANLQFNEIESLVTERTDELMKLLVAEADTSYSKILRAGSVLNIDQFRQAVLNVSLKPDIMGQVIPHPIDTSYLRGLRGYMDMYVSCIGARKALVTNFYSVKKAGYLARKFVLLQAANYIREDVHDCGTAFGLYFTVLNKDHAETLIGRYVFIEEDPDAILITKDNYKQLDKKEVILRSPVRCACKEGVCQVCYGQMSKTNIHIHSGIYGSNRMSQQFIQRQLSTKHLLKTISDAINWPNKFQDYFVIDKASITPNVNLSKIIIDGEDLRETEDGVTIDKIYCYIRGDKELTMFSLPFSVDINKTFMDAAIYDDTDNKFTYDVSNDPNEVEEVFNFTVQNNELSAAMNAIFSLIEKEENVSVDDLYIEFNKRIQATNLSTMSINIEMIIRSLVRDPDNSINFPDYTYDANVVDGNLLLPPENILKLPRAILNSPSITNSLAFQNINEQFLTPDSYSKVQGSIFDILFT